MHSSQPISQITDDTQPPYDNVEFPDSQARDTPSTESDEDDDIYTDIPVDIRSIDLPTPPTDPPSPEIPIITNHEEMINAIEEFENDIPTMMSIIINSTNEYTPRQQALIEEIIAESEVNQASNSQDYRFFHNRLNAFAEDLAAQLLQHNTEPTSEELEFFEEQKSIYRKIYDTLIRSAFPYSAEQSEFLHSYRENMYRATGNPDADADIRLMNDLRGLLNSMARNDHIDETSPHRFYIDCTIEYHAHKIAHDLEYVSSDERTRDIPSSIPEGSMVNIANFLTDRIQEIFAEDHPEEHGQIFNYGLREIYDIVCNTFRNSNLTFSSYQTQLIQGIHDSIREIRGNSGIANHDTLHLQFLGFMDSFRRQHPQREMIESDGFSIVDSRGAISRAIKDITWNLLHMKRVTEQHLESFPIFSSEIPNIVQVIARHFLRIYPRNPRVPLLSTSGPGGSSTN